MSDKRTGKKKKKARPVEVELPVSGQSSPDVVPKKNHTTKPKKTGVSG